MAVISGIVGIIISLKSGSVIYSLVSFAWAGIGNTFSVVILLIFSGNVFQALGSLRQLLSALLVRLHGPCHLWRLLCQPRQRHSLFA